LELFEAFAALCGEPFSFLVDGYGCRIASTSVEGPYRYAAVVYQNDTTGVGIYYDGREGHVLAAVMRLANGKPPPYGDEENFFGLWTLVLVRGSATEREEIVRTERENKKVAAVIQTYADRLHKGDFSVFPELAKVKQQRSEEYRQEEGRRGRPRAKWPWEKRETE
jgi:hypothetical protein